MADGPSMVAEVTTVYTRV